jgi:hypothetical protein
MYIPMKVSSKTVDSCLKNKLNSREGDLLIKRIMQSWTFNYSMGKVQRIATENVDDSIVSYCGESDDRFNYIRC